MSIPNAVLDGALAHAYEQLDKKQAEINRLEGVNVALREALTKIQLRTESIDIELVARNALEGRSQGGGWRCVTCRSGGDGKPAVRDGKAVCPLCLAELQAITGGSLTGYQPPMEGVGK